MLKQINFIYLLMIFIGGCSQMETKAPLIPMEDFFRNPEKSSFRISPDGNHIAYMKPWETRMNVFVLDIANSDERRLTSSKERSIYGFLWLGNNRIGYVKDDGGDENMHFYAVNIDGSNEIDLTPFENVKATIVDDLDYEMDSNAEVDLNLVMNSSYEIIEIQGTGEKGTFSTTELNEMINLGKKCIEKIFDEQENILNNND